ncbi:hypothetical protein [Actinacidiphila oryziradicis]|uniref:recombination directionality factor n=1 Tax=Actinacidiphila oryziradicis TaxID=2571141 RepID=UPI0023F3A749|nr:hypothetical protein [Actinacidiphila oryziradicis]MCW2870254.1 Phage protein [Actinacidiphila oryziradicis]
MPILDIQRRGQQIGRIRIGQQVATASGKMRPAKLDTFRFTTQSQYGADAIATLYGGVVREWNGEFEVITEKSEIGVTVPPRDQIVSQWYEMWNKGGCMRRCDSQIEQISGNPCLCPHANDPDDLNQVEDAAKERARLAGMNPPRACKVVTRISVMIPDLPGLGVFRLDTGSYYAAVEIGDAAAIMQVARDRGVFLPALLRIEQRKRVAGGTTKNFPVPVLEVTSTFREIASGALNAGGITAQLPPAPNEPRRALTSGRPTPAAPTAPVESAPAQPPVTSQQIADLAVAATSREEIEALAEKAKADCPDEDLVCIGDDTYEELGPFLRTRWRALSPEGRDEA